ncbi:hypothetical protein QFZ81_003024 [Paenibacillus sp. V4I9]|uniref:hypothetical protein n=1 Tax=Paenibacillus sp. V4I9 TaxID=3042308 RepID=UPI00277F2B1C|nr:hypothetical protein [Paenibacillus sp. V4I9]MDQ0887936.1 hypothetical protein [Paenibacillus sp. V4I9]
MIIRLIRYIVLAFVLILSAYDSVEASLARDMVEATMNFKVSTVLDGYGTQDKPFSDESFKPIPDARLIVIDRNGNIAANGITDHKGEWSVKINTPIDTVADGFNEFIKFDVPVNEHGDGLGRASITLRPIRPEARNEPSFDAAFHRFTVFGMLDYYASKVGLAKQKPIKGVGEQEMPWSAKMK